MTAIDINERLCGLIRDLLMLPEADIKVSDNFYDDLGLDSLDMIDLFVEIEVAFDVELDDQIAVEKRTVGEMTDYLLGLIQ